MITSYFTILVKGSEETGMNTFSTYHPAVIFFYFAVAAAILIMIFDPVILAIGFVSQTIFYMYLKGFLKGAKFAGRCLLFVCLCTIINALINHRGIQVIFMLGGLPVTVECLIYGMMTGFLLADSMLVFGTFQSIMTSEKMMCLFAGVFPSFALLFSMALGLIPKLKRDYAKLRETHKQSDQPKRFHPGVLSALIGLTLEDSLDRGISMKYRGYGQRKRTSICRRTFGKRDAALFAAVVCLAAAGAGCYLFSQSGMEVFPYMEYECDGGGAAAYVLFAGLFQIPMVLNVKEELRWSRIVSNI